MINPQLETFITVASLGSFSKAADELFVSPTAIMKQINMLENRLKVKLFVRTNHGLELTEAGKSLIIDAKFVSEYSARAIDKAKSIGDKENSKSIRIGTSIMTPVRFLLDIWTQIQTYIPQIKIELIPFENTPENAREILRHLGQHIDLVAGIYNEKLSIDNGFAVKHICNKKIHIAVPLASHLASKEVLNADDLIESGLLLINQGWNEYIDSIRDALSAKGACIYDFDFFNINAFNRAVKENIPIIAIDGWENIHPLLKIIPIDWEFEVPFGIMYSPKPSDIVKQFINTLNNINELNK